MKPSMSVCKDQDGRISFFTYEASLTIPLHAICSSGPIFEFLKASYPDYCHQDLRSLAYHAVSMRVQLQDGAPNITALTFNSDGHVFAVTRSKERETTISTPNASLPPTPPPLPEPPVFEEWLLTFVLGKADREAIIGDLTERFDTDLKAGMSAEHARRRYSARAWATMRDQAWPMLKRLGIWGLLMKTFFHAS